MASLDWCRETFNPQVFAKIQRQYATASEAFPLYKSHFEGPEWIYSVAAFGSVKQFIRVCQVAIDMGFKVVELHIADTHLDERRMHELCPVLRCIGLKELHLPRCQMEWTTVTDLAHLLDTNAKEITVLDLSDNRFNQIALSAFEHFGDGALRYMNLSNNNLSGSGFGGEYLARCLKTLPLEQLYLSNCKIEYRDLLLLLGALHSKPTLTHLYLDGNAKSELATSALASLIRTSSSIQSISMELAITNSVTRRLRIAIAESPSLHRLNDHDPSSLTF